MELIQTEEQRLEKLEGQTAEIGRLDLKDQEDEESLRKKLEQKMRDGESPAACQKVQAELESVEQRRRGRATIRQGYEDQAKATRTRIAELYREQFSQGVPQRVTVIKEAVANLTHDLLAHLKQFSRLVAEDVTEPVRVLQAESQKHTGKVEVRTERLAGRLRAFVTEWGGQGKKILEDIHREAQR